MLGRKVYLGFDLREREMRVAAMMYRGRHWRLIKAHQFSFAPTLFEGNLGVNRSQIIAGLCQLREKIRHKVHGVHLVIPTQHVFLRRIQHLPDLGEKELAKVLKFEIGHSIHLPFEDPYYDFAKLDRINPSRIQGESQDVQKPERVSDLLLVASSKSLLEQLVSCWEEAGYNVLSVDIAGLALNRLINYLHPGWLTGTELILDIGSASADLHIFHQGVLVFTRQFNLLDEAAGDPVIKEDGALFEAAATIETLDQETDSLVARVVQEIERSHTFFQFSLLRQEIDFERIIVTGEATPSMIKRMEEFLVLPVETIRFQNMVRLSLGHHYGNLYSVAMGVGMRGKYHPLL